MANLPRKNTPTNTSSPLQPITTRDSVLAPEVQLSVYKAVQDILATLGGQVQLGPALPGFHTGNLDGQFVKWTSTKDTPIAVPHGLGRIPSGWFVVNVDLPMFIWRDKTHPWTTELVWMVGSESGANVMLFLF